jgi:hypothetical protein
MPTINTRQINGVLRTSEPVWANLERLAEASLSWFTYDTHNGKYSWVINEEGNSVASLEEKDIIGPIQISGSGLTNMYNACEIEFADTELRDQPRYSTVNLPVRLRNAYEPDNTLQMSTEFVNNQPQAEYLASVTLCQARLDRAVTIVMDYTKINLQAGDIVDLTSDTYGWEAKEFRIMRVREIEGDDGSLRLEFLMSEYDDTIYSQDISQFLVGGPSGIRAMGSIGVPGTPTIQSTTFNSLPAQIVSTTVPEGIVDRMQFWVGVAGNATSYNLSGTVASTDADSFTVGDTVTFTTTSLDTGTWSWKTRGINARGVGPFSAESEGVVFDRKQAPDAIKTGTPIRDADGNMSKNSAVSGIFALGVPDAYYYAGNNTYKGAVYTNDLVMFTVGADEVSGFFVSLPNTFPLISISTSVTGTTYINFNNSALGGIKNGIGVWFAVAQWDEEIYYEDGFSGLTWSDWYSFGQTKDEASRLTGNVSLSIGASAAWLTEDITLDITGNTQLIAIGYSTTKVPDFDEAKNPTTIDPLTGFYIKAAQIGFLGNTVIEDTSIETYEIPGTANATPQGVMASPWIDLQLRLS